jgi:hypothetical protein
MNTKNNTTTQPERTHAQKQLNFTREEGIAIQARQLAEYKTVLLPRAFELLQDLTTAENDKVFDGFDVVRGDQITSILHSSVIPAFKA